MINSLKLLLDKVFELYDSKRKIILTGRSKSSSISFLNNRFKAEVVYEKHFLNTFRVIDTKTNKYKNLKLLQILNNNKLRENISEIMNQFIKHKHPGLVNIEEFYFDDHQNRKNFVNLLILEEPHDYITLKDFLFILEENFQKEINVYSEKLLNMAKTIFIELMLVLLDLHENKIYDVNANLFSIIIYKKDDCYGIKLSDVELPSIMKINFKESVSINHAYFDTFNKTDNFNLILLLTQIINCVSIKNNKKTFHLHKRDCIELMNWIKDSMNDELIDFFLEKVLKNTLINEKNILDKEDSKFLLFYNSLMHLEENLIKKLELIVNELEIGIFEENNKNKNISDYLKIIFIALSNESVKSENNTIHNKNELISICFFLLNFIKEKCKRDLMRFINTIIQSQQSSKTNTLICFLIQKYNIFIQNYYKIMKIDMMEVLCLFIDDQTTPEEINNLRTAGTFSLILSYVKNCEIDYTNFLDFVQKVSKYDTMTLLNFLEIINVDLDINKILIDNKNLSNISINLQINVTLNKMKVTLFKMLNLLSIHILKQNQNLYHLEDILHIINYYPLIKRRKQNFIELISFISQICLENEKDFEEESYDLLLIVIFNNLQLKRRIRMAFLYSVCINNDGYFDNNEIFLEFGLFCKHCKMNICLVCAHRCHIEHGVISLGYNLFKCDCIESNICKAVCSIEMPDHIKKVYVESTNSDDNNLSNDIYFNNHYNISRSLSEDDSDIKIKNLITSSRKESSINNLSTKTPQSNVFISVDYETVTIQTKFPICQIHENLKDNKIILEINEETLSYFEVEVILGGYYDQIAIGVTSLENYPKNEFAGYLPNSIGYHADDGKCYVNSVRYSYGVKFGSHDIIGCGITMSGNVYFTHNGCILPLLDVKLTGSMYSLISLRGKYASVKINHNSHDDFLFKHKNQQNYKNALFFSKSFATSLLSQKHLLDLIYRQGKKFNSNEIIFTKYSKIMDNIYEIDQYNLNKEIIEENEDELKASPLLKHVSFQDELDLQKNTQHISKERNWENINNSTIKIVNKESKINNINKQFNKNSGDNQNELICKCGKNNCVIY